MQIYLLKQSAVSFVLFIIFLITAVIIVRNRPIWTWFCVAYQRPQRVLVTAGKFVYLYAIFEVLKIFLFSNCREKQTGVPLRTHRSLVRPVWCELSNWLRLQANILFWIWRITFFQTYTTAFEGHAAIIFGVHSVTKETAHFSEVSINFYNSNSGARNFYNSNSGARNFYNSNSDARNFYNSNSGARNFCNSNSGARNFYNSNSGARNFYNSTRLTPCTVIEIYRHFGEMCCLFSNRVYPEDGGSMSLKGCSISLKECNMSYSEGNIRLQP